MRFTFGALLLVLAGCQSLESTEPPMTVEHLNPETLHSNPVFSQAIAVSGPHRTIFVGGQNAVAADGTIIGKGDAAAQTVKSMQNIQAALEAGGASPADIVKLTIYIVQGHLSREVFLASQEVWGPQPNPPTISVLQVAGLANPDFLVEIDAVAVVPE